MPAYGVDTLNTLVQHYVYPQITDNAYFKNNALLYRLLKSNKRMQQGGTQIEIPLMYQGFTNRGGSYRGYDTYTSSPQDTIKSAFVDWKQYRASFSIDGLTLIKADSDLAIANLIAVNGQQLIMEMADMLATGIYADGVADPKGIDGLGAIFSDSNTYAGINRATNPWWGATIDSTTTSLSVMALRGLIGNATFGGTSPSILLGNGANYNRVYALGLNGSNAGIRYNREPGGSDSLLMQAGFTNVMVENLPFVRDDNAGSTIYAPNEDMLSVVVSPRADFHVGPFEKAFGQEAWSVTASWVGNLMSMHGRAHAALTAINS